MVCNGIMILIATPVFDRARWPLPFSSRSALGASRLDRACFAAVLSLGQYFQAMILQSSLRGGLAWPAGGYCRFLLAGSLGRLYVFVSSVLFCYSLPCDVLVEIERRCIVYMWHMYG